MFFFDQEEMLLMRNTVQNLPFLTARDLLSLLEAMADQRRDYIIHEQPWPPANDDLMALLMDALEKHFGHPLVVDPVYSDHRYGLG